MENLILVAEDDEDLCRLLTLYISRKGFNVVCLQSLTEAETYLQKEHPVLVLLDNHFSDGVAMDYIDQFKLGSPGVPMVLMTADFIQDLRKSPGYLSFDGLLLKPFSPDRLDEVLERIAC